MDSLLKYVFLDFFYKLDWILTTLSSTHSTFSQNMSNIFTVDVSLCTVVVGSRWLEWWTVALGEVEEEEEGGEASPCQSRQTSFLHLRPLLPSERVNPRTYSDSIFMFLAFLKNITSCPLNSAPCTRQLQRYLSETPLNFRTSVSLQRRHSFELCARTGRENPGGRLQRVHSTVAANGWQH